MKRHVLSLYKNILLTHRRVLPIDLRELGDKFVQAEFKYHKKVNSQQANQFINSWKEYLQKLQEQQKEQSVVEQQLLNQQQTTVQKQGANMDVSFKLNIGRDLTIDEINSMSAEQRDKLKGLQKSLYNDKDG